MHKRICVYKITSPTKKVYIGSTIDFERRMVNYENLVCKNQKKLYNSLVKYGFDNHIFEVLCECDLKDVRQKEAYYGQLYNCLGQHGLNCILPKHEGFVSVSDETRRKISAAGMGRPCSEKSRQATIARNMGNKYGVGRKQTEAQSKALSARNIGNKYNEGRVIPEAHKKAISAANIGRKPWLGKKHTEEYKKKMSALHKGKVLSESTKEKLRAAAKQQWITKKAGITPALN